MLKIKKIIKVTRATAESVLFLALILVGVVVAVNVMDSKNFAMIMILHIQ